MNYKNGIAVDAYGCVCARTLNSIDPDRLAQAYLKLLHAHRPSENTSPRNSAINAKVQVIGRALASSLC